MNEEEAKALFDRMHQPSTEAATDTPFSEEEMAEIRARATGNVSAEQALCIDFWGPELQPKDHQPRPGLLQVRGSATAGGCRWTLFDPLYIRNKRQKDGWMQWSQMVMRHKEQCQACREGTSVM